MDMELRVVEITIKHQMKFNDMGLEKYLPVIFFP